MKDIDLVAPVLDDQLEVPAFSSSAEDLVEIAIPPSFGPAIQQGLVSFRWHNRVPGKIDSVKGNGLHQANVLHLPLVVHRLSAIFAQADRRELAPDEPQDVAVDQNGVLFVADSKNSAVRRISPGGEATTLAGGSTVKDDGSRSYPLGYVAGIAVDKEGYVFTSDSIGNRIYRISPEGKFEKFAASGIQCTHVCADDCPKEDPDRCFADGKALDARFDSPQGIAAGPKGELYVADEYNYRVRKLY